MRYGKGKRLVRVKDMSQWSYDTLASELDMALLTFDPANQDAVNRLMQLKLEKQRRDNISYAKWQEARKGNGT